MKKLTFALFACAVLSLGIIVAFTAFASPEKKIRWRLQEMAKDFNLARPGPCTRGLTDDFRDETSGIESQDIRLLLTRMTFSEKNPKTYEFLYRVALPEEELTIVVDEADPSKAHVDLVATFEKIAKGEWGLHWRVSISADLTNGDGGWQVRRTTHETLEGRQFR